MTEIKLNPELMKTIKKTAAARSLTVDQVMEKAVLAYLRDEEKQQMDDNISAYRRLHPELVEKYPGKFVAIHGGDLVDHDDDFRVLHNRIREHFGRQPVLIRQVTSQIERTWTFRSPHFARGAE